MGLGFAANAAAQPLPPAPRPAPQPVPIVIIPPANIGAATPKAVTATSITFLLSKQAAAGAHGLWSVTFREEATKPDYVTRNGGASVTGAATVDCNARAFQLQACSLFKANNLNGEPVLELHARPQWRTTPPSTLMRRVVDLACAGTGAPPATRAAKAPSRQAPAPAPARPIAAAKGPSDRPGRYWVQVGASNSADLARKLLRDLGGSGLLHDLGAEVRAARVHGATVFRSLVGPFRDRPQAAELCLSLSSQKRPCFVRAD
jgi:hypothetical protein